MPRYLAIYVSNYGEADELDAPNNFVGVSNFLIFEADNDVDALAKAKAKIPQHSFDSLKSVDRLTSICRE